MTDTEQSSRPDSRSGGGALLYAEASATLSESSYGHHHHNPQPTSTESYQVVEDSSSLYMKMERPDQAAVSEIVGLLKVRNRLPCKGWDGRSRLPGRLCVGMACERGRLRCCSKQQRQRLGATMLRNMRAHMRTTLTSTARASTQVRNSMLAQGACERVKKLSKAYPAEIVASPILDELVKILEDGPGTPLALGAMAAMSSLALLPEGRQKIVLLGGATPLIKWVQEAGTGWTRQVLIILGGSVWFSTAKRRFPETMIGLHGQGLCVSQSCARPASNIDLCSLPPGSSCAATSTAPTPPEQCSCS